MSAADFRQIAHRGKEGRTDRLFRAAVSAFSSLTRPTRREALQLEQLALPLFDSVSVPARRFAAAALSDSPHAPHGLVRLLCDQPVDVAAPLLIRSPVLSPGDLIDLIARHGREHARVIGHRAELDERVAQMVERRLTPETARHAAPVNEKAASPELESTRRSLRSIMAGASQRLHDGPAQTATDIYERLRETVLSGRSTVFHTTLADALGIDFRSAATIASARDFPELVAAMRYLGLTEEQAFLLVCAAAPKRFPDKASIAGFVEAFRRCDPASAAAIIGKARIRDGEDNVIAMKRRKT